jgi:hypothetical protein
MCGTLKHEKRNLKPGNPVPYTAVESGKSGQAKWSGFAQNESLAEFWSKASEFALVRIEVDSFNEQGVELKLKGSLKGIGLRKDVAVKGRIIGRKGEVKIVTRPPMNDFERKIHKRWPVVETSTGVQQFTEADVVTQQLPLGI